MAIIDEMDQEAWSEWVKDRPECIQILCKKLPPDRLYQMKKTGAKVTLHSYSEDGTVTVDITSEYNSLIFERRVFGINPDDLEECELPDKNAVLGAMLTEDVDINNFIDIYIRPGIGETEEIILT